MLEVMETKKLLKDIDQTILVKTWHGTVMFRGASRLPIVASQCDPVHHQPIFPRFVRHVLPACRADLLITVLNATPVIM
jgi:hypothetical protein